MNQFWLTDIQGPSHKALKHKLLKDWIFKKFFKLFLKVVGFLLRSLEWFVCKLTPQIPLVKNTFSIVMSLAINLQRANNKSVLCFLKGLGSLFL